MAMNMRPATPGTPAPTPSNPYGFGSGAGTYRTTGTPTGTGGRGVTGTTTPPRPQPPSNATIAGQKPLPNPATQQYEQMLAMYQQQLAAMQGYGSQQALLNRQMQGLMKQDPTAAMHQQMLAMLQQDPNAALRAELMGMYSGGGPRDRVVSLYGF